VPSVIEKVGVDRSVFTVGLAKVGIVVCWETEEVERVLEEVVLELVGVEEAFEVGGGIEVELEVVVVGTTGGVEVVDWTEEEGVDCFDDTEGDAGGDVDVGEVDETVVDGVETGGGGT